MKSQDATLPPGGPPPRSALLGRVALGVLGLAAAVALAVYWLTVGQFRESTEDAYVDGNVVSVTAQVSGVVTAIRADDTDFVRAGHPLVLLDDTDARLALARAKAQLARTVRQVRAQYAAVGQTQANLAMREVDLARARADLAHRHELLASGAISGEEVRHAEQAVRAATAARDAAREQLAGSRALVDRASIATQPDVLAAASQLRDAYVAAYRTDVPAPVSGMVAGRHVQLGQKIAPGVPLMSVVPLDHLWVEANFKESQLRHLRIGQPVTLTADVYGGEVIYHGSVVGQDAGTGSAFSLLPAQNATGNWIKVVQRVPIRIALDPRQVAAHPLQLGLSMRVTVDTRERNGERLASTGTPAHGYHTDVFAHQLADADALVQQVIQANR
ncbi:efflux RND transporter periplasmic adaptor subunit [Frateuria terrea]|uniref:Membrane fusion protein, multidrug efflux system n=1 Tax=Frateuria terrea TaxID=529704 RepID=A0A1H6UDV6_9GAMM|nr:HlyD family efflux transporter periplasmic adaptor subunit [Frateuria terrea]SEI89786.1 membrane fusion protein, multidrug efflux system [Frateuria terrea]SFP36946.1 membrane fusion protein, multidrug efflux system [Frateuria terrea]